VLYMMYLPKNYLTHAPVDPEWRHEFIASIQPEMKKVAASLGVNVKYVNYELERVVEVGPEGASGTTRAPNLQGKVFQQVLGDIITSNVSSNSISRSISHKRIKQTPVYGSHTGGNAVFASCVDGCDAMAYKAFIDTLKRFGHNGDIVLIISNDKDKIEGRMAYYLKRNNIVAYANPAACESASRCKFADEYVT
jgi:DNA-binding transcriptional regulator YdaS (Cro superfamily)